MNIIQAVPTNIITGFLGVGKTTAINYLLAMKPKNERWAVLMNEFGEVGIDGSLLGQNTQKNKENSIFIKEVAGGCMCCTSGLPMQVALNCLLSEARPHRLIIEPTGLGHPREVLEALSQPHYKSVLNLQATITMVDAKKLSDTRYTSNSTFNEQLAVADVIVGNKAELYAEHEHTLLKDYCKQFDNEHLFVTENAQLNWQWLGYENIFTKQFIAKQKTAQQTSLLQNPFVTNNRNGEQTFNQPLPDCGYIVKENRQDGFYSIGWLFDARFVFSRLSLSVMFMGMDVERVKGVFITDEGVFGYNKTCDGLTEICLDDAIDSRIEVIDTVSETDNTTESSAIQKQQWQAELLAAICEKIG